MLMALLFVAGVMNVFWVVMIALFVMAEKILVRGELLGHLTGVALVTADHGNAEEMIDIVTGGAAPDPLRPPADTPSPPTRARRNPSPLRRFRRKEGLRNRE